MQGEGARGEYCQSVGVKVDEGKEGRGEQRQSGGVG